MDKDIKKIQTSLKSKNGFFAFRVAPVRHFRNLVIVSILLFFGIAAYHGYLFYQIKFIDPLQSQTAQALPVPLVNENKLEMVLGRYDNRAEAQAAIMSASSTVIDPSK